MSSAAHCGRHDEYRCDFCEKYFKEDFYGSFAPAETCQHNWEYWQMGAAKCLLCDNESSALVAMREQSKRIASQDAEIAALRERVRKYENQEFAGKLADLMEVSPADLLEEINDLREQLANMEKLNESHRNSTALADERAIAQQNEILKLREQLVRMPVLVEALQKLARLGNGDSFGNSIGNDIAIDALRATGNIDPPTHAVRAGDAGMIDIHKAREMYINDPVFHSIVDAMYVGIAQMQYTPSELRAAAMFASIKFEQEHSRSHFFPTQEAAP